MDKEKQVLLDPQDSLYFCEKCDKWYSIPSVFCNHYLEQKNNKELQAVSARLRRVLFSLEYDIRPYVNKISILNIIDQELRS